MIESSVEKHSTDPMIIAIDDSGTWCCVFIRAQRPAIRTRGGMNARGRASG
jgi:hypothetical protein